MSKHPTCMKVLLVLAAFVVSVATILFSGCTKPSDPNQLREKTAETTAEMKSDAKAVAQGIREGLQSPGQGADHPLDLNSASKSQLTGLPGISGDDADRIIAARPYSSKQDVLDRHIVSLQEYRKIADSIEVKK
jgi:DNA uptake protein ComE-like DNA-binding protein